MADLLVFGILSAPVIILSRRTLLEFRSHGFYRFFSWECILWLFAANYRFWFVNPFIFLQILSWIFLFFSGYLVLAGVMLMKNRGKPVNGRDNKTLYTFEKTTQLVDTGIFAYIRHPLYSSLIFLTWGIFLKRTDIWLLLVALASTGFLLLTALFDEKECIRVFGARYTDYMNRSKRFVPFVF